ncbi:MAG: glycosyltransferase [Chloroflexota bacterium]
MIVDGGSTDNTLEFVKTQPQIRFICEPDRGMYDALNKGLALTSGHVIGFLNLECHRLTATERRMIAQLHTQESLALARRQEGVDNIGAYDMYLQS